MHRITKRLLCALVAVLLLTMTASASEPAPLPPETDFLTRLLSLDAETAAALTAPAEEPDALSAWLNETIAALCTPELLDELLRARLPLSLMGDAASLTVNGIEAEPLNPDTSGAGRFRFTVQAEALLGDDTAQPVTFFGRLTKDDSTALITALRLNRMP